MGSRYSTARVAMACAAVLTAAAYVGLNGQGQQPVESHLGTDLQAGNGADMHYALFATADANTDGAVSRAEFKAVFDKAFATAAKAGSATQADLQAAIKLIAPRLPLDSHVEAMMMALPAKPAAAPKAGRKILIFNRATTWIHTPIPLLAKMIEAYGTKIKGWTTTVTYDPADFNEQNLKQYDAVVINSSTGQFLDDPNDAAATAARKKALLDFVRGGKGLVGIHGAADSYHAPEGRAVTRPDNMVPAVTILATQLVAQGDKNADSALGKDELTAVEDLWHDKLDLAKKDGVRQGEFLLRVRTAVNPPPPRGGGAGRRAGGGGAAAGPGGAAAAGQAAAAAGAAPAGRAANAAPTAAAPAGAAANAATAAPAPPAPAGAARAGAPAAGMEGMAMGRGGETAAGLPGRDTQLSLWPRYSKMLGGFFKFHFGDTPVILKIDDPNSPLTSMFKGKVTGFRGEVYTFSMDTWSRENLHILTSVDYSKMSDTDKAKESYPRTDHDHGVSWIKREGAGRVFYSSPGNEERVFFLPELNAHVLAGLQYALGDLKADDSPSIKAGAAKK